ncbi:MAG: hypothetical protein V3V01_11805 [Acidimicrobiales bacterium]
MKAKPRRPLAIMLVLAMLGGLLSLGGVALAMGGGDDVSACVNKRSGKVRAKSLTVETPRCKKKERAISLGGGAVASMITAEANFENVTFQAGSYESLWSHCNSEGSETMLGGYDFDPASGVQVASHSRYYSEERARWEVHVLMYSEQTVTTSVDLTVSCLFGVPEFGDPPSGSVTTTGAANSALVSSGVETATR